MNKDDFTLANNVFSDKYIATLKLVWDIEVWNDKRSIKLFFNGNVMSLTIDRISGELNHSFPSIGFKNGIENFSDNAKTFTVFKDFWEYAQLMKKVEDIYE